MKLSVYQELKITIQQTKQTRKDLDDNWPLKMKGIVKMLDVPYSYKPERTGQRNFQANTIVLERKP